jgi:hypothetical protein
MTHGKTPDDSELQALYRAAALAGGDEPDAQLDARILAAARAAAGERQARRQRPPAAWWKRWLVPVSVTAVAVLGVSLTLRVNEEQAAFEAARQMAEAPPASPGEATPPLAAEQDLAVIGAAQRADRRAEKSTGKSAGGSTAASASAKTRPETSGASPKAAAAKKEQPPEPWPASTPVLLRAKPAAVPSASPPPAAPRDVPPEIDAAFESKARREMAPSAPLAPSAPPPAAFGQAATTPLDDRADQAAKTSAEHRQASERRARSIETDQALSAGAAVSGVSSPSLAPAGQDAATAAIEASPERWLEKIRDLRRSGRLAEARLQLDRFRLRYPDFALPADLK